jgi:hypothetical protein
MKHISIHQIYFQKKGAGGFEPTEGSSVYVRHQLFPMTRKTNFI